MSHSSLSDAAVAEWRKNWRVVLAGFVGMGLGSVPLYATGVFFSSFEQEFGWSRAEVSAGAMIYAVAGTILGPFIGLIADRIGPRRIGMIGVVVVPIMLALLSRAGPSIWSWWALWCGLSFGLLFMKPLVWTSGVSSLFSTGRGLALAVTLCGTALASSLTPLICNFLLERFGWRVAFMGLGGVWAALAVPVVFAFFSSAQDQHRRASPSGRAPAVELPGVSAREGLLSLKFLKLALAAGVMAFTTTTIALNLVPILVSTGQSRGAAAGLAATIGISAVVGRLSAGVLLDRFNANLVSAISLAMPIAACALLLAAPGSFEVSALVALIVGLSLGAEVDAVAYLASRHFGLRSFGVIFGTIGGVLSLTTGGGPVFLSYVYDVAGDYTPALIAYIPLCAFGAVMFLTLGRFPQAWPAPSNRAEPVAQSVR